MKKIMASVLGVTFMCTTVLGVSAEIPERLKSYDENELKTVIVTLSKKPVLDCEKAEKLGTDYLDTSEADKKEDKLINAQKKAVSSIESFYPDIKVRYTFTSLVNGFVCTIPEELIDDVESCPDVEKVQISQKFTKPRLYDAKDIIGAENFVNKTDCTGQGESVAVLDTELDASHKMFAPLSDDKAEFSKEDIENYINNNQLNAELDVDKAYISSKIPLAYNYVNYDDHYDIYAESNEYHGTHVSGIAVGNKVTDENGYEISGVAPDAQLIFTNVFSHDDETGEDNCDDYDVIAAMEDSVKLGVTAINLSLGTDWETYDNTVYVTACDNAEKAGIVVSASAGNEGKSITTVDNPDNSTLNTPGDFSSVMSVGSADNRYMMYNVVRLKGEEHTIPFADAPTDEISFTSLYDGQTPEYVYCENPDNTVYGKVAVIPQNGRSIEQLINTAGDEGAEACIIVYDKNTLPDDYGTGDIPAIIIKKTDDDFLKSAEHKVLDICDNETDVIEESIHMSDFSSYGVSENLELKPDITAVGGNVVSASRGNQFEKESGTSMASPFIAGCTALISQKMKKDGIALSGMEKSLYVKNMLMNSAVPLVDSDSGLFYSPRKQGAGLVNLDNLINDNLIVTGKDGRGKVSLCDKLTDTFKIPLTLMNVGNEDISFESAEIELMTDSSKADESFYLEVISGSQKLNWQAGLSAIKEIPAGQTVKAEITVNLDANQTAGIKEKFVNGFFVEGYILLSGAENCCDISVPVMGYYGNWDDISIFNYDADGKNGTYLYTEINGMDFPIGYNWENDIIVGDDCYISPNNDAIYDYLYVRPDFKRSAVNVMADIYDSKGNKICTTAPLGTGEDIQVSQDLAFVSFIDVSMLKEDEEYTVRFHGQINYTGAKEEYIDMKLKADMTAPEIISSETSTKNGRKIVTLKIKDNGKLQGIEVIGKGKGGIYGSKVTDVNSVDRFRDFMALMKSSDTFYQNSDLTAKLCGYTEKDIDFAQLVPAKTDKDGIFTVEYDVTDLTDYDFLIGDSAFNITEFNETGIVKPDNTKPGTNNKPDTSNKTGDNKDNKNKGDGNVNKTDNKADDDKKNTVLPAENPGTGAKAGLSLTAVILGGVIFVSGKREKKKSCKR